MATVDDLTFTLSSDGTYYSVKAAATTIAGDLEIPSEYSGLPVKKIDASGFKSCASLTSVVVPESITALPESAFQDCTSITSLTLPSGLTTLGTNSVRNCKKLTSIDLPAGLTSIGSSAFNSCSSLTSIDLPAGLTSIGNYAFSSCSSLTSIDLPAGLTSIWGLAFSGLANLESITVDPANPSLYVEGNCCIRRSGKSVVTGCNTSVLPDYVTSLDNEAFASRQLTVFTIPASVNTIASTTFLGCALLTSFKLEGDAPSTTNNALSSAKNLTSVHVNAFATGYGETWGGKSVVVDNPVYYKNKRICKAYLGSKRKRKRP